MPRPQLSLNDFRTPSAPSFTGHDPTTSFVPHPHGPRPAVNTPSALAPSPAPADGRLLLDDSSSQTSSASTAFTEDARRQACAQYRGRCCNCGCTDHSLRWYPLPFKNVLSLMNPELATLDPDGSMFETWKRKMRNWRRKGPQRRHPGNGKRHMSDNASARSHSTGHPPAPLGIPAGAPPAPSATAPPAPAPSAPAPAAPLTHYGATNNPNSNPNTRQPGTFRIQHDP